MGTRPRHSTGARGGLSRRHRHMHELVRDVYQLARGDGQFAKQSRNAVALWYLQPAIVRDGGPPEGREGESRGGFSVDACSDVSCDKLACSKPSADDTEKKSTCAPLTAMHPKYPPSVSVVCFGDAIGRDGPVLQSTLAPDVRGRRPDAFGDHRPVGYPFTSLSKDSPLQASLCSR